MSGDDISQEYLSALVHADATLDQIDAFCGEFYLGSGRPFVWNTIIDVSKLINASVGENHIFQYKEVRNGPSRHLAVISEDEQ